MTDLEKRISDMETILLKLLEKEPSALQRIWTWCKPYLVPFILGMILGGLTFGGCGKIPTLFNTLTTIEKQAALGGAAIPFPSGNPLPSPSPLPPGDSTAESTASSLMSTSAEPSPSSPQADGGKTKLTRSFRPLIRRIR